MTQAQRRRRLQRRLENQRKGRVSTPETNRGLRQARKELNRRLRAEARQEMGPQGPQRPPRSPQPMPELTQSQKLVNRVQKGRTNKRKGYLKPNRLTNLGNRLLREAR